MVYKLNTGQDVVFADSQRDNVSVTSNKRIYNETSSAITCHINGVQCRLNAFSDDLEIRSGTTGQVYVDVNYSTVVQRSETFSDNFLLTGILLCLVVLIVLKVVRR